jgi:hypothetical protein
MAFWLIIAVLGRSTLLMQSSKSLSRTDMLLIDAACNAKFSYILSLLDMMGVNLRGYGLRLQASGSRALINRGLWIAVLGGSRSAAYSELSISISISNRYAAGNGASDAEL